MSTTPYFPPSPHDELTRLYVGKSIRDVPMPAAVLDVAVARQNCDRMLAACKSLGLSWRAHVKTHKTVELTKLQVGDSPSDPVNLIVSTLTEAEFLLPTLQEYVAQGRPVNVLDGLPIGPGSIPRLAAVGKALGNGSISVMLDYPDQVPHLSLFGDFVPQAFIKVNMGGQRAGVVPRSQAMKDLIKVTLEAHAAGKVGLKGLYSHAGQSYGGDSRVAAINTLRDELSALLEGAEEVTAACNASGSPLPPLTLSVGASPTALAVQNLLSNQDAESTDNITTAELRAAAAELSTLIDKIKQQGHIVEIHAGVYPTLDLQQLAAHSLSSSLLSWKDISFTVVAEVCSRYPSRGKDGTDEYLIGAGGLALGREACKAYPGMALLTPWGRQGSGGKMPDSGVEDAEGWMVGRFSQEHGILTWRSAGGGAEPDELAIGQAVRLWPNHACITGSHFGWYFVVDSSREGKEDEIVDIYVRTRGW
ncbi:putative serine dehydratase domain-containing protein [Plectosphaerella cucumerina]|uniref:Serine dehydratase domain-containing protein n=1 Tax=Plectosphaerella cucumerina TaxID=40658 RepID=A0A8K0TP76_9PEZI|nr:putative serine dehydratase domain-containing protein [Plectosphaerella cucumerina]